MLDRSDVTAQPLREDGRLPLVVRPVRDDLEAGPFLRANRAAIDHLLLQHGAILFRGFSIDSVERFEVVIQALTNEALAYEYRSTPREKLGGATYTASEYPAMHTIPMHCENAYQRDWPTKLLFACARAPRTGGQTPLADMVAVMSRISPDCFDSFRTKGVAYLRNYHDGLDLSWRNVFQTESREEVGAICRRLEIDFEWVDDGERLRTRQLAQGVARHHALDQTIFFNQAHLFHVTSLGRETADALIETFGLEDLPRHACFGDGSEIPSAQLAEIRAAFEAEKVHFDWQQGDVLLVDNMQVAHGREPFTGDRLILASLCDAYSKCR
ncbi:TauD/TfdA family dioxygenase [Bradyrhizobium ontarionense]|uniref:TauD/TfdA family dioxygenase n=1 Tax=Bradyrhizobium ontarionense TaxID=2898149 RepID=A0ABY3R5V8_9BRAD|nr:TauD/TfdA family dioxygenase [Bradyrhizobium sp. A19]UFZ02690.1 TauD/TfdA family dioxygenase [Bradyrhizobium sp. A19]